MNGVDSEACLQKLASNTKTGRKRLPLLHLMALTGMLLAVGLGAPATASVESLLHKKAPQFVRMGLIHREVNLSAYRGQVVLLNFWATWCAPCQLEIPRFVTWQRQYGPRGLQVIGISMDDDPVLARELYKKLKMNYPVAMGDEKLGELYGGVLGLPVTYLIDRKSEVRAVYQGETDLDKIEMQLKPLLLQP